MLNQQQEVKFELEQIICKCIEDLAKNLKTVKNSIYKEYKKIIFENKSRFEKNVLAIDPGFRSGCKVVCLNAQGDLMHYENVFPHPPQNESVIAKKRIQHLVDTYKVEAIAIGNGTAARETERLVKQITFSNKIDVFTVSEAGASVYSASAVAREEFPDKM